MDIIKYDVYGGSNIGVYAKTNSSVTLIPPGFSPHKARALASHLGTKYVSMSVANTRLLGSLCAMNDNGILLPKTAFQSEYDSLIDAGLEVGVLDSKYTALGNLICANGRGAVVSPWLSKDDCTAVSDALGIEVVQRRVAGFNQTGAVMAANGRGAVIHPESSEDDISVASDVLKVRVEHSSINNGVPYVASGILANDNSVVVGGLTTGPEIMMLTRAFLN